MQCLLGRLKSEGVVLGGISMYLGKAGVGGGRSLRREGRTRGQEGV